MRISGKINFQMCLYQHVHLLILHVHLKNLLPETRGVCRDEPIARGSNLWKKKNVTISGERIAKVSRVAAQVAVTRWRPRSRPAAEQGCAGRQARGGDARRDGSGKAAAAPRPPAPCPVSLPRAPPRRSPRRCTGLSASPTTCPGCSSSAPSPTPTSAGPTTCTHTPAGAPARRAGTLRVCAGRRASPPHPAPRTRRLCCHAM